MTAFTAIMVFSFFYFLSPPPLGTTFLSVPVTYVDTFFSPAHAFRSATGLGLSFRTACAISVIIHGPETLYTWSLCKQYVKGTKVTVSLSRDSLSPTLHFVFRLLILAVR